MGVRACLWRSALFFYLSVTDRLWLTLGQPRLVISPVSLFDSNKDSMEVTLGSKSSASCHWRDIVLFESNNNLSNRKCPWHGKFSSSSGINFYLNQIIIHLIRNVNNVGIFWFNFYLNQIKWYLVWENTSVFQSTLVQHIGYANHRLPKIGEFFRFVPSGKTKLLEM